MCQMCDEYDAELRRMGIEPDPARRAPHATPRASGTAPPQGDAEPQSSPSQGPSPVPTGQAR